MNRSWNIPGYSSTTRFGIEIAIASTSSPEPVGAARGGKRINTPFSLSPGGRWFVHGYKNGDKDFYVVYRRSDGAFARSEGLYKGLYGGDIRFDPAP